MKGVKMRLRPCIVKDPGGIPGDNMIQYQIFIYTCKSFQLQPVLSASEFPFHLSTQTLGGGGACLRLLNNFFDL